jgi:hypothetical protein
MRNWKLKSFRYNLPKFKGLEVLKAKIEKIREPFSKYISEHIPDMKHVFVGEKFTKDCQEASKAIAEGLSDCIEFEELENGTEEAVAEFGSYQLDSFIDNCNIYNYVEFED